MRIEIENRPHGRPGIGIDAAVSLVQTLAPTSDLLRFEGIAFSSSGNTLAVATADTNTVLLFRRKAGGTFEETPYTRISGPASQLNYPHDLAFCASGEGELLAVAQRTGSICFYKESGAAGEYCTEPVFSIRGPEARLNHSDGVAFVPPGNESIAACNFSDSRITFYRRTPGPDVSFTLKPEFKLKHPSLHGPDGLAFSQCGKWLAVANHGNHTVSIYERRRTIFPRRKIKYGPVPVTVIRDPGLRYPHSVAFTPKLNHLVVSNAGANYFSVYRPERRWLKVRWSQSPAMRSTVGSDSAFNHVNAGNKMEGGPKGIAIHENSLAVCGPEHGIRIYALREPAIPSADPALRFQRRAR